MTDKQNDIDAKKLKAAKEFMLQKESEKPKSNYWIAKSIEEIVDMALKGKVKYGKDLIAHTSKYLGPKGSVAQISNGLNCQNCHLDAGTKIFGNN